MNFEMYERKMRSVYSDLAETVGTILESAIKAHPDLRLQQIKHRAKDPESLKKKLEEVGALESEYIEEVRKDLAGCRLVFYTNSDVSRFLSSGIVSDNFEIDWDRTKIHHPSQDTSNATELFISNNYVIRLNDQRVSFPEYARFRGLWCEVQVQTTLNHAWSEMAHDTIYKKPKLKGFGGRLMEGIGQRMEKIMRDYLLPAGYEFQKVATEFERLSSGKKLLDRGELNSISSCKDNNELHDLLERFAAYVLPNYDGLQGVHHEIRSAVVSAIKQARETPAQAIIGSHPGYNVDQVVRVATTIINQMRYVNEEAVEKTFDVICDLFPGAKSDDERRQLLHLAKNLSIYDRDVWKHAGPLVQQLLVERIRHLNIEELALFKPIVMEVLGQVLQPKVEGTSSTYNTITIHTGAVVPSKMLTGIRANAINILKVLFRDAKNDAERREVIQKLSIATTTPYRGNYSNELIKTILDDAANIVEFYKEVAADQSYELLQKLEHDLFWLYHNMPRDIANDPTIAIARQRLTEQILAFRDLLNSNQGFAVYKTLVGFQSIFPPAWEDGSFNPEAQESYRNQQLKQLLDEVTEENAEEWLSMLSRCARTESNDIATFPSFERFLKDLGRTKPHILISYLDRLDDRLANFLPAMLTGLESGGKGDVAQEKILHWIDMRQYLPQVIWYIRFAATFEAGFLERALRAAIEIGDDDAVFNAVNASAVRHGDVAGGLIEKVFLPAIEYLTAKGDTMWVNALWPFEKTKLLLQYLNSEQADQVLSNLIQHPQIDYHVEDVLASISVSWPTKVVDFFGSRLEVESKPAACDLKRYEAIPYQFHRLHEQLAKIPEYLVEKARSWFKMDKPFFQYRGGQLLSNVFPNLQPEFELILRNLIDGRDRNDLEFVSKILLNYEGKNFINDICKEIVALLPPEDTLLNEIEAALNSTGVVTGEFGFVEAYKRKKTEIEPWLRDPRENVKLFARSYVLSMERQIAAEQRRSEEDLEMRKREYGDDGPDKRND